MLKGVGFPEHQSIQTITRYSDKKLRKMHPNVRSICNLALLLVNLAHNSIFLLSSFKFQLSSFLFSCFSFATLILISVTPKRERQKKGQIKESALKMYLVLYIQSIKVVEY